MERGNSIPANVIKYRFSSLMLTTEVMIADAPDEKSDGGMGGMGM